MVATPIRQRARHQQAGARGVNTGARPRPAKRQPSFATVAAVPGIDKIVASDGISIMSGSDTRQHAKQVDRLQ